MIIIATAHISTTLSDLRLSICKVIKSRDVKSFQVPRPWRFRLAMPQDQLSPPQEPPSRVDHLYGSLPLISNQQSIRLLDLHKGDIGNPLRGTLRVVTLTENPEFAALSYVWGPWSSPRNTISCNDFPLEITENCFAALRALRALLGSVTIWVDSICVNQGDDEEKAVQIPLMGSIYTNAQPTYIWLGSGSESTDRAMGGIKYVAQRRLVPVGIPWIDHKIEKTPMRDNLETLKRIVVLCLRAYYGEYDFHVRSKHNMTDALLPM